MCDHRSLVESLEVVLAEVDILAQLAHQRRLATLKAKFSASVSLKNLTIELGLGN